MYGGFEYEEDARKIEAQEIEEYDRRAHNDAVIRNYKNKREEEETQRAIKKEEKPEEVEQKDGLRRRNQYPERKLSADMTDTIGDE